MSFNAKVLADSISPAGIRLTSFEATYPRIIHAEQMTHRVQSRNSASTRAIPLKNQLKNLLENPFVPEKFGVNQPGMQAYNHLSGMKHDHAVEIWLNGRDRALTTAIELLLGQRVAGDLLDYNPTREYVNGEILRQMLDRVVALIPDSKSQIDLGETTLLNIHKQLAGRGLESYAWHTVIVTGTEWDNYFGLRDHPEAQGEIATIAHLLRLAYENSIPRELEEGEWHLPLVEPNEFNNVKDGVVASAARCAAVSYNRHSATREFAIELKRYTDLCSGGHMSPLEHQARPFSKKEDVVRGIGANAVRSEGLRMGLPNRGLDQIAESLKFNGNLRGWHQHRKDVLHESNFSKIRGS